MESSTTTAAARNLAAEVRAVEEGHRARLDQGAIVVTSDTHHGKAYRVTAVSVWAGQPITFTCTPEGDAAYRDDHLHTVGAPGVTPCKHAALAARRLEREGLAELAGGRWLATHLAQRLSGQQPVSVADVDLDDDPFIGVAS